MQTALRAPLQNAARTLILNPRVGAAVLPTSAILVRRLASTYTAPRVGNRNRIVYQRPYRDISCGNKRLQFRQLHQTCQTNSKAQIKGTGLDMLDEALVVLENKRNLTKLANEVDVHSAWNKIKDANALKKRLHAETEEFLEDSGIAREVLAKREQESPKRQEEIEEETPGKWNETLGGLVYLTLFVILCVSLFMQLRLAWRDYQSHKEFEQNTAEMARGKAARDEAREAAEALRVEETRMIQDKLEKLRQMYSKN